ncbi:hypothetical protein [Pseudomonas phage vB_PaeM_PS119XW]|uniref:Uncharacterized protein n=1 Tax=Pseudomonas phage vB_PaeM_PS119XW TaxID=2601632 RepID=A0A5C1K828_9CAUD|nr:hypothetical protein PP933_gp336 [Pseudomonas phage vB_PaeM_PS119XW]QEM42065.1 hypothetical protein [Pseudomonas phage vB_PaeM_PS119XW]
MKVGDQFYTTTTLRTQDNPNVTYHPGWVLTLEKEMEGTTLFIGVDSCGRRFVVGPHNGVATDIPVDPELFRRAVARGYDGSPEFFRKGYNRILEMQLKVAMEGRQIFMISDEALDKAIQLDSEMESIGVFDPMYEQHKASRDAYLNMAEILNKLESLVVTYREESRLLFPEYHK